MKRLIYIFLSLIAILAIGVIFCNRAVIKTAEYKMYDDVSVIPYNRVGVLLGTSPKGISGNPNVFYIRRVEACVALYQAGKIDRILVSGDNSRMTYTMNRPVSKRISSSLVCPIASFILTTQVSVHTIRWFVSKKSSGFRLLPSSRSLSTTSVRCISLPEKDLMS